MTRYLLDTNHVSAIWRKHAAIQSRLLPLTDAEFGLCTPSIGELWFMAYKSKYAAQNIVRMEAFVHQFAYWPFDLRAAREYGKVWTELETAGTPIPTIDAQIAAIARANDLTVLTADRHFKNIAGLRHENWL